jgi:hypothetical protein
MISNLKAEFPDQISAVALTNSVGSATAKEGDLYANVSIMGTNPDYLKSSNMTILEGRYLNEKDMENYRNVAVSPTSLLTTCSRTARILSPNRSRSTKPMRLSCIPLLAFINMRPPLCK